MIGPVPEVVEQIQNDDRRDHLDPAREAEPARNSPALLFDEHDPEQKWHIGQKAYRDGVQQGNATMKQ